MGPRFKRDPHVVDRIVPLLLDLAGQLPVSLLRSGTAVEDRECVIGRGDLPGTLFVDWGVVPSDYFAEAVTRIVGADPVLDEGVGFGVGPKRLPLNLVASTLGSHPFGGRL